jgi:hypothetical protein
MIAAAAADTLLLLLLLLLLCCFRSLLLVIATAIHSESDDIHDNACGAYLCWHHHSGKFCLSLCHSFSYPSLPACVSVPAWYCALLSLCCCSACEGM